MTAPSPPTSDQAPSSTLDNMSPAAGTASSAWSKTASRRSPLNVRRMKRSQALGRVSASLTSWVRTSLPKRTTASVMNSVTASVVARSAQLSPIPVRRLIGTEAPRKSTANRMAPKKSSRTSTRYQSRRVMPVIATTISARRTKSPSLVPPNRIRIPPTPPPEDSNRRSRRTFQGAAAGGRNAAPRR